MGYESVSGRRLSRLVRRRAAGLGDKSLAPVFLLLRGFLNAVFTCNFQLGAAVITGNNLSLFRTLNHLEFNPANRTLCHVYPSIRLSNHLRARENSFCSLYSEIS